MKIEKFMFTFWHINPKVAFWISAFFPIIALVEGISKGVELTLTFGLAISLFYIVNLMLKVLDDFL